MSEVLVETELVVEVLETESDAASIVETEAPIELVIDESPTELLIVEDDATVIEVIETGPQTFVPSEEDQVYAKRVDFVDDQNLLYRGEAATGTAESAAAWRIRRITFVGDEEDVVEEWADGNANFDKVWDDRASLTYS